MDAAIARRAGACLLALACVGAQASTVSLQATATFEDAARHTVTLQSNSVEAQVDDRPPTINFYTDATYSRVARAAGFGKTLFVGIQANGCNRRPGVVETMDIALWSSRVRDSLTVAAVESGPDSGVFRFALTTGANEAAVTTTERALGRMNTVAATTNDVVNAKIEGCGHGSVSTWILIDPSGIVFDSATNAPLPGASVTLVDLAGTSNGGQAGQPARVFGFDGVTPWPSTVKSGVDGTYAFPLVAPGQYRLDVAPPANYRYPSTVAPATMPATRHVHLTGSFGGTFTVDPSVGAMLVDLPLDEIPHGISVSKTASRPNAEVAESVGYTVVVRNVGSTDLDHIDVQDTLPTGFAYLRHTATVDGQPAAEPVGGRGPVLSFSLPAIASGQSRTLRYRASVGALALQGDGVNRAQARAALPFATISNVAAAAVQVQQGVFTDRAMVLGKVFADCNGNGVQDAGEPGIPGVRLLMEDGSFVVTDGNGNYSFYGVAPRSHVLKIDPVSLPAGTTPMAASSRNAGDGASRFVDPHRGELHRADFALSGCSARLDAILQLRRGATDELGSALKLDFRADAGLPAPNDARGQPASGLVGEARGEDGTRYVAVQAGDTGAKTAAAPTPAEPTLAQRVADADPALAFLDLHDGQALPAAQATIRVKGPSTLQLSLAVDGREVGADRIGTRLQDDAHGIQARDYVGVPLPAGEHVLTLTGKDQFGNPRAQARVSVRTPGELARIAFGLPAAPAPADGETAARVSVDLLDARGVPVVARTAITLDATLGEWDTPDLDPREAGVQTFVEGGHAEFGLRAPRAAGDAELRARAGSVTAKALLPFVPALRPLVGAGIVEGAIDLHKLKSGSVRPAGRDDGFEETLDQFARGDTSAGGRAALYLKGQVLGSSLLTVAYDSAKDKSQSLFRDIQPDRFYPVYGDSSAKGFDAQSTSRLYVRVEHGKSWVLYGDFTTQDAEPARQLGAYQRSLTGAKAHVEQGATAATAFASRATSRQVVDELPANGTSGPFFLSAGQPVENSETVTVLVRDRNQPALVLRTTPLARFADYDIDPLTGRLLLHAPVASLDPDLNPESLRIAYEAASGGPSFVVAGADAKVRLGEHAEAGIALVMDQDPLDEMKMASASATLHAGEHTTVTVEAARTEHALEGSGSAGRAELKHDGEQLKVQAQAVHTDTGFDNPSSTIGKGRTEADLKASYAVGEKTRIVVDAAHSADVASGDRRDGVLLGVEHGLDNGAKVEVGARVIRDQPAAGTSDTGAGSAATVRARIASPVPGIEKATAFVEGEQAVNDGSKHVVAVGGDYRLTPGSRVYVRQEVISSLTGPLSLDATQRRNATLVGVDSDVAKDTHLFSEYRVRDAIDGRSAEAALGLRNQWQLAEGLRANTTFERVRAISGGNADENAALTAAIEWARDPSTKASGRVELRDGNGSRGVLSTLGVARKLDADWTLLARNAYALTDSKIGGASPMQERFQLGMAYRDNATNRVNGLARYEWRREDDGLDVEQRNVHLFSSHVDWQVARGTVLTGAWAGKHAMERVDGHWIVGNAQLASARLTRDLNERWDAGLALRVLADANFGNRATSLGAELGYRVIENLWVSLGYNLDGFRDRDLSDDTSTQGGAYMRVRFKFDESLFGARADAAPTRSVQ